MLVTSCKDNICRIWVETVLLDDGLMDPRSSSSICSSICSSCSCRCCDVGEQWPTCWWRRARTTSVGSGRRLFCRMMDSWTLTSWTRRRLDRSPRRSFTAHSSTRRDSYSDFTTSGLAQTCRFFAPESHHRFQQGSSRYGNPPPPEMSGIQQLSGKSQGFTKSEEIAREFQC